MILPSPGDSAMRFRTISSYKSYDTEAARLWVVSREVRAGLRTLEVELRRRDLDEWLQRTARQHGPHLWVITHRNCEIRLQFKPLDCKVLLISLKT